jgi:AAA+ ATPase superfamily predicted ATPase
MTKFQIGQPASPEDLIDRENEVQYLISRMKSPSINYNVAVIGFRRIGKTSILRKVENLLSKYDKFVIVYFDVKKNMAEPKIFLTRLEKTIFEAYIEKLTTLEKSKAKASKAINIISHITSAISGKKIKSISTEISTDGTIIPKIEFGDKVPDYSTLFLNVLETIKAFAEKSNLKFVVILDEFQDFKELDRYPGLKQIFDLFRSIVQERGKKVSFIISGSQVNILNSILNAGQSPLFTHFQKLVVQDMDKENSLKLFIKYVKARKIKVDNKAAEEAYTLVGGQPYYLMALAEEYDVINSVSKTFNHLLTSPLGTLKLYVDYVLSEDTKIAKGGPLLRTILRALSDRNDGYSYSELAKKISQPIANLPKYLDSLLEADLIIKSSQGFVVRDRVVREYLRLEAESLT